MKKLWNFVKKHKDMLLYVIFGGLTTVVNYVVYLPCYNLLHLSATVSNILAWAVSVLFAFLTNKHFVFCSHNWSANVLWPELVRFVTCRAGSGALETLVLMLLVDILHRNGNLWKLIVSMAVVVINYVASKWVVFRGK